MSDLGTHANRIRSKNAGPFWITIDIFCDADGFEVIAGIPTDRFAARLGVTEVKRFDLPDLGVVKISLPRPQVQGSARDRDMHGAALAEVLRGMPV
ncbi:hypothetical protein JANAI62_04990 [Jannaschia pagri]|uniref:DUF4387 domain-containing protein n=1 Tax=Jannaschia pagri TaxID=2829797 RepID=A0ABQ4NHH8_9RHOB|nr:MULTISPECIES: DUF4387 family protein [unclassified Jannaschia]GIT90018.1 hypothetical protein JANAI61_04760 [Jannaschia sp. AI_61]GIT93876.1 hypothetical protein JANAI62_04990 [Jannaschia sp. AI_62]